MLGALLMIFGIVKEREKEKMRQPGPDLGRLWSLRLELDSRDGEKREKAESYVTVALTHHNGLWSGGDPWREKMMKEDDEDQPWPYSPRRPYPFTLYQISAIIDLLLLQFNSSCLSLNALRHI
ncbi:hypothetical protein V6N12_048163 [Hibiscus sabdariffa]|uniref:Uncharacterized protein n=1 Tax=Hibiscus sabdariffa TaxID=183260 RepID=A0ABR2EGG7_9ROSI